VKGFSWPLSLFAGGVSLGLLLGWRHWYPAAAVGVIVACQLWIMWRRR
jgi:dolichyl-phosphate-mannose--protein O-mannosyl transferase